MVTRYPGTVLVKIYGGSEVEESTDKYLVDAIVEMYNASCDIMNADDGIIDFLNRIWEYKHPNEVPNTSKELQSEYDCLADRMTDSVYHMLSWTHGVDLKNGYRYALLNTPYLDGSQDGDVWIFPVNRMPL